MTVLRNANDHFAEDIARPEKDMPSIDQEFHEVRSTA